MSTGGQSSTTVGLPQNSTAPGMGSLGIGGGIYGNPYQVMGLSQPSGLTLQGQGQQAQPPVDFQSYISQFLAQQPQQLQQQPVVPYFHNASAFQGQGAALNRPRGMQAGLGSLVPGNYASPR